MPEIPLFNLFSKESRQQQQFTRLRNELQSQMMLQLMERRKNNPEPTAEEAAIGVLQEQLEPQVRDTVFDLNRKGYKTVSSGFNGTDAEYQIIEGNFILDDKIKQKLAAVDVVVTTEPWWKWEMRERMGITDAHAPEEEKVLTAIRFRAAHPDLQEMENKWKQIAALLLDRRQSASSDALR